ncbi:unnamed protein product [Camellia sinensis]
MKLGNENNRPFVLTRAGFIGSQRYAATWTGDNLSTWEHLHMSISMVLQLGLSGQPLSGPDIGGFEGNATPKLFGRWMGLGAMFPFCRGHSDTGTIDHEPWSFGEEVGEGMEGILVTIGDGQICYRELAKSIAEELLFFEISMQTDVRKSQRSQAKNTGKFIYVGTITNIYKERSTVSDQGIDQLQLVLPKGIWLSFDFDDSHPGGSIIPSGPAIQHVGEANPIDDLSLLVALDEHGKAKGVLFEDDGDGYEFTRGEYLLTTYVAELESSVVTVRISQTEGSWKRPKRCLHVQLLLGGCAMLDAWGIDGEVLHIMMPSEDEVSNLVSMSEKQYKIRMENAKPGGRESLMFGDIRGGVVIERHISFLKIVATMIDNMMSDFPHNLISYVNNNQFLCDRGVFSGGFVFSTLQHQPLPSRLLSPVRIIDLDSETPITANQELIQNIKSIMKWIVFCPGQFLVQFWKVIEIGGLCSYRLISLNYQFYVDGESEAERGLPDRSTMMSHRATRVVRSVVVGHAAPRLFFSTAARELATTASAGFFHVNQGKGAERMWVRFPVMGVRNCSTVALDEKKKKQVEMGSAGGVSGGDKAIVSYWGVSPAKVTEEDGTEWRWTCFKPWETYKSDLSINLKKHHVPVTFLDKVAFWTVKSLRYPSDVFFQTIWMSCNDARNCGCCPRHGWRDAIALQVIEAFEHSGGWIKTLLDEAENERMHLMTFMEVAKPRWYEHALVFTVQGVFFNAYFLAYLISPKLAHRMVGYLEEEAIHSYTEFLKELDKGNIENVLASAIAIDYWQLPPNSTLRDVVMVVRADEAHHRMLTTLHRDIHYQGHELKEAPAPLGWAL